MKQETKEFLTKVESLFEIGKVHINMFDTLLEEWSNHIGNVCYKHGNTKQTYLKLNQLKLTTRWFEQHSSSSRNKQLNDFLNYLLDYIDVEIKGLKFYTETVSSLNHANMAKDSNLKWTAPKRNLIELICALNEAKCIKQKDSSLQGLVVFFEQFFEINLENYHSELNKMANRKPLDNNQQRAYFLQKLVSKFNERMQKK